MKKSEITFLREELIHDGGRYHIKTGPLICRANQWTGFYMITASTMKELKEKDYLIRTLLNMKCKSIDDCASALCNNLPSAKSPSKNRIEISDTPAENTPKETITGPKSAVQGSYHNNNLQKDKSCIDIIRANPKKIRKFNTANTEEEQNEKKQKKVQEREEKPETISTRPSDTNADVTNRVYIVGDSIVKHISGYGLSKRVENCKVFVKSFSGAKVRYMEDYIQPTLRETLVMLYPMTVQMT